MGRELKGELATVIAAERGIEDGVPIVTIQVDPGDGIPCTTHLLSEPGVDALPLPGDEVLLVHGDGKEQTYAQGFADPKNAGTAGDGERRTYARDASGKVVIESWLKADGSGSLFNEKGKFTLNADGSLIYNDGAFTVDVDGNAKFKGEVTAMAGTPDAPQPGVKISTHLHGTGVGPTTAPTPGT